MPDCETFLRVFGLSKHMTIGGYELTGILIEEEPILRFVEYLYRIKYTFTCHDDHRSIKHFLETVMEQLTREQILHHRYLKPYHCKISNVEIIPLGREMIVTGIGRAVRMTLPLFKKTTLTEAPEEDEEGMSARSCPNIYNLIHDNRAKFSHSSPRSVSSTAPPSQEVSPKETLPVSTSSPLVSFAPPDQLADDQIFF